ncbi:MAG: hypothetical protein M1816_004414, partial [Peltula sp. TS41687]
TYLAPNRGDFIYETFRASGCERFAQEWRNVASGRLETFWRRSFSTRETPILWMKIPPVPGTAKEGDSQVGGDGESSQESAAAKAATKMSQLII